MKELLIFQFIERNAIAEAKIEELQAQLERKKPKLKLPMAETFHGVHNQLQGFLTLMSL
jgi:hypothetical protein